MYFFKHKKISKNLIFYFKYIFLEYLCSNYNIYLLKFDLILFLNNEALTIKIFSLYNLK